MAPDSIWFWLIIGVGTAVIVAVGKWVWSALTDTFREWIREPIAEAKVRAEVAANHAETMSAAVGQQNGHGNLFEMIEHLIVTQEATLRWQKDHDAKDDITRADVVQIKTQLGMS